MIIALQIALAAFANFIPVGGVVFRGWSPATALTLYWCENVFASILIAARIAIHRRLTRKRGHYRPQLGAEYGADRSHRARTFLAEFATSSLFFCLVHGVFLVALSVVVLKVRPDPSQMLQGLRWMVLMQVAAFLLDLPRLRGWPFAVLKRRADVLMGRVVLIHLSLMGGMLIAAVNSRPAAFFAAFATLKTLADVGGLFPASPGSPAEAPRWFVWFANRIGRGKHWKTGQDVATWWRETTAVERRRAEEDEQPIDRPTRSVMTDS